MSDEERARRRRLLRRATVICGVVGVGVWLSVRLPSAPDVVWASIPISLDPKPWANVRAEPGGAGVPGWGWFEETPRTPRESTDWDDSLHVVLECDTPIARRVFLALVGRRNHLSQFAEYHSTPDRVVASGETWVRYERD